MFLHLQWTQLFIRTTRKPGPKQTRCDNRAKANNENLYQESSTKLIIVSDFESNGLKSFDAILLCFYAN